MKINTCTVCEIGLSTEEEEEDGVLAILHTVWRLYFAGLIFHELLFFEIPLK